MRRREFITLFGGAAAWPVAGHAQQQSNRMRLVGMPNSAGPRAATCGSSIAL
jgi:hypothetical protein